MVIRYECSLKCLLVSQLFKVADVVVSRVSLGHANIKAGVAWYAEFVAFTGRDPCIAAIEPVLTRPGHAFHDLRCAGVEGQRCRQDHADRFFGAVCTGDTVADALAIKVNVGLGCDADVVDFLGGHGRVWASVGEWGRW